MEELRRFGEIEKLGELREMRQNLLMAHDVRSCAFLRAV